MAKPEIEPATSRPTILSRLEGLPIIAVFLVLLIVFMVLAPEVFLSPNIYTTFLSTLPPLMLLAIGLTFVIGAGEIDLSFPSIIAFSGFLFAVTMKEGSAWFIGLLTFLHDSGLSFITVAPDADFTNWFGWIGVVLALLGGLLVGYVNGVLVARVGIPSFIATLATQFFWAGLATVLSGGKSYALRGASDTSVWQWLVGRPLAGFDGPFWTTQLPLQALWTAIIVVFLWFIMNRHRFGEHILFLGDSNDVSRVVGINVEKEKIRLFTLMGGLAALAAIFLTLENKNFFGNQGQGYLLLAIASVLIGGTSIFGGRATIVGTVFGCLVVMIVEPGLVATGSTGAWVLTIRGLIFLIAIVFYLYVDEPARRQAMFARLRQRLEFGRGKPAGKELTGRVAGRDNKGEGT
ncbi:MAG TPA: ABC transporter permease [Devosiaceae bacterium]|nr:ABC transporter permease [Devosiaceae bacterium]